MNKKTTAPLSLHPPVIAGVPTGGERSGLFDNMEKPLEGSLEWYREMGRNNPHISDLVRIIENQKVIIVRALEAMVEERENNRKESHGR